MPKNGVGLFSRLSGFVAAKKHELQRQRHTHPSDRGSTRLNIPREFPLYRAKMDGSYSTKAFIACQSIKNTIPFLAQLSASFGGTAFAPVSISAFAHEGTKAREKELNLCFDRHGSDKSTLHDYHIFYAFILSSPESVKAILEIGLGSNNPGVPSNMGVEGKPGASLRAWRDFCVNAEVFGADIDQDILFQDQRIHTFFVDQTDPAAFKVLAELIPSSFDLIIDDGLHAVDANIQTMIFALSRLKPSGWFVIEDIAFAAEPLWQVVASLLPSDYASHYIKAKKGCLFAVQRLP